MTQVELRFFETMPAYMGQLVSEIAKLNLRVKELTDKVNELKSIEKQNSPKTEKNEKDNLVGVLNKILDT